MTVKAPLDRGQAALQRGAWADALHAFEAALVEQPDRAEALEGQGLAAWWLDLADVVFASREQAYRAYRARGDEVSAARVAVWLAWDHDAFRGEYAITSGWLHRARELLEGNHDTAAYAWLSVRESAFALLDHGNPDEALTHAEQAIAAGRASGSVDYEMVGRALRGFALATSGRIPEGMQELDGVNTAVLAGEMQDRVAIGLACCYLISACDRVRDYDRAVQWCARLRAFCERWQFRVLFAVCRTQYAAVCMWRGAWGEAERELEAASSELTAVRPGMVSEALVRLGELRRRQGRLDEATSLFDRSGAHSLAAVGHAAVALDRGDWESAGDLAERHLRSLPAHNRTERVAALELLVRARVARGDPSQALAALIELQGIADQAFTTPLRGSASLAHGVLSFGTGDFDAARRHFEDAVDLFQKSGASFERGRAGLELSAALIALGRHEAAGREVERAVAVLAPLEATVELDRAHALRARLAVPATSDGTGGGTTTPAGAALTRREVQVLELIAEGLGNQAIAERLTISEHTVHRHVANMLIKLGVPSRSAAVAQAARLGLL
jgi:ATP/maltotriose-dependent transcriptional regulator MalT